MRDVYDLVFVDTVGPRYAGDTVEGIGGSEHYAIKLVTKLAAAGLRVLVRNGTATEKDVAGVRYENHNINMRHVTCKTLLLQRHSDVPSSVTYDRLLVQLHDRPNVEGIGRRDDRARRKPTFVCVSGYQASFLLSDMKKIVIRPFLHDLPAPAPKTTNRFLYASAGVKGWKETLAKWQKFRSLYPGLLEQAKLHVIASGYDGAPGADGDPSVVRLGKLDDAALYEEINRCAGIFYVNTMEEMFPGPLAIATELGTRAHVLCLVGMGGIPEALGDHRWLTTDPDTFQAKFVHQYMLESASDLVAPLETRLDFHAKGVLGEWLELLGETKREARVTTATTANGGAEKKRPHINENGEWQSDKYPTCPAGKVPLSVKDKTAQDVLWEYADRRRAVDADFADDLQFALRKEGFSLESELPVPSEGERALPVFGALQSVLNTANEGQVKLVFDAVKPFLHPEESSPELARIKAADPTRGRVEAQLAERTNAISQEEWSGPALAKLSESVPTDDPLGHGMQAAKREGLWLEFGVAGGLTLRRLAAAHPGQVVGFDSFEGLPEAWNGHAIGTFGQKPPVVPGAEIVVGRFEDVVRRWLARTSPVVSLVHVDCDLYASAEIALRAVAPYLADGAVIVFDELVHYPGFEAHEWRALYEVAIRDEAFRFEWLAHRTECDHGPRYGGYGPGWQASIVVRKDARHDDARVREVVSRIQGYRDLADRDLRALAEAGRTPVTAPDEPVDGRDCRRAGIEISPTGYWSAEDIGQFHECDQGIVRWLASFLDPTIDVTDFGCGVGAYLSGLSEAGFHHLRGIEGVVPHKRPFGNVQQGDLTTPLPISTQALGDVICLEVAEHIPREHEKALLDNVCGRVGQDRFLVLSWAIRGQGGDGHVNCRNNDEVIELLSKRGFVYDAEGTDAGRKSVDQLWWFRNTLMVFRRRAAATDAPSPHVVPEKIGNEYAWLATLANGAVASATPPEQPKTVGEFVQEHHYRRGAQPFVARAKARNLVVVAYGPGGLRVTPEEDVDVVEIWWNEKQYRELPQLREYIPGLEIVTDFDRKHRKFGSVEWAMAQGGLGWAGGRLAGYERYMFADDDLHPRDCTYTDIFAAFEASGARVAHPGLTRDSFYAHECSLMDRGPRRLAVPVPFTELMAPMFTAEAFLEYLPYFGEMVMGHGLERMWAQWERAAGREVVRLDATPMRHTRPVASGAAYQGLEKSTDEECLEFLKRHGLR